MNNRMYNNIMEHLIADIQIGENFSEEEFKEVSKSSFLC